MPLHSRKRKCDACGKPLGSTLVYCYACQSDDSVDTSDFGVAASDEPKRSGLASNVPDSDGCMNDVWAAKWKLQLGVDEDLVFEQHGYDKVVDYL